MTAHEELAELLAPHLRSVMVPVELAARLITEYESMRGTSCTCDGCQAKRADACWLCGRVTDHPQRTVSGRAWCGCDRKTARAIRGADT